jgi:hypothetical protein
LSGNFAAGFLRHADVCSKILAKRSTQSCLSFKITFSVSVGVPDNSGACCSRQIAAASGAV